MSNRRITRNSYKRKIILVGIMLFMSIALISTGFAAWVISTGATNETEGNVEIGIVEGAELEFLGIQYYSDVYDKEANIYEEKEIDIETFEFRFEPKGTDKEGRVRYKDLDEVLKLKIVGYIRPVEFIKNVTFQLVVPEKVKEAATKGYIVLPQCASEVVEIPASSLQPGAGEYSDCYKFEYTIEFKWGSVFNELNPGIYYDSDPAGIQVETNAAKAELEKFRATMYGYDYLDEHGEPIVYSVEDLKAFDATHKPEYKVIISANIN